MITDSFFTFACAGVIGLLFGTFLTFLGYRFFLVLLPIWGFFFGLALGAQSVQALFGQEFLATVTSWVVGFVVGALFAVLSYAFYMLAVAIIGGSLGYTLVVGLLTWIGMDFGLLVWAIGLIAAVLAAFVTIRFNLQKWVVIIATSVLGTATIFGTILAMFNPAAMLLRNPVRVLLDTSPFLLVLFLCVAALGVVVQVGTTKEFEVKSYDRMSPTGV
jgi:hypothetical protein